jgi:flagellar biosynthesis protein FlhA
LARGRLEERRQDLLFFQVEGMAAPFVPWRRDQRGTQTYVKLTRGDQQAFLFAGTHGVLEAEIQKGLMRLVNDGWSVEGEVTVTFEGKAEPGIDPYVYQEPLLLELGQALLPLVDPARGAPLLEHLGHLRDEVHADSGLVVAGVRVRDNLRLEPNRYLLRLKDAPTASGELFLDRILAVGSHEQLGELEGWATVEPSFRMKAKWIEPALKEKAEHLGCLLLGPLPVLITHLKNSILAAGPELLGLQETYDLLARLRPTHPVVVEDFLAERRHLRALRKVLQNLLRERVPIRDLVSILETAGDMLDRLHRTDLVTEFCRMALARTICWSYVDNEGVLRGLALAPAAEQRILAALQETDRGPVLTLSREEADQLVASVRKALEEHGSPPVLFTDPPTRLYVRRLLERSFPLLGVLATTEISAGVRVEVCGQVDFTPPPATRDRREGKLFRRP